MPRSDESIRRALTLDALGTIIALEPPAPALCRELSSRFELEVTEDQARRALGAEISYYRANLQSGRDADSLADLRGRCAEVLRAALPIGPILRQVGRADLTQALLASLRFAAFADARPALVAARQRGQRVVVASNWDISLPAVLEQLELTPLLDGIVTSAQVGAAKPALQMFSAALKLARTDAEHAVHVGDSLVQDVCGARAAGLEAVLLRRDGGPGPVGVRTIATLAELA